MFKKAVIAIATVGMLALVFSAVAAEGDKAKAKQKQEARGVQQDRPERGGLLAELRKAYDGGDKEEIGRIIARMEQRRNKVRGLLRARHARGDLQQWQGGRRGMAAGWQRRGMPGWQRQAPANRQHRGVRWGERTFAWGGGAAGRPGTNAWGPPAWRQRRSMGGWGRGEGLAMQPGQMRRGGRPGPMWRTNPGMRPQDGRGRMWGNQGGTNFRQQPGGMWGGQEMGRQRPQGMWQNRFQMRRPEGQNGDEMPRPQRKSPDEFDWDW